MWHLPGDEYGASVLSPPSAPYREHWAQRETFPSPGWQQQVEPIKLRAASLTDTTAHGVFPAVLSLLLLSYLLTCPSFHTSASGSFYMPGSVSGAEADKEPVLGKLTAK